MHTHTLLFPFSFFLIIILLFFSTFLIFYFFCLLKSYTRVRVRGMNRTSFYVFLGYFLECHATNLMCWARVYKPNHSENIPSSVNEQNVSLHISIEQWQSSWNKKSQSHNGVLIWAKVHNFLAWSPLETCAFLVDFIPDYLLWIIYQWCSSWASEALVILFKRLF